MKLKQYILTHRPYFACTTLFSTILSLGLLKSPVLPLTVVLGAMSGTGLAVVHKGSSSKRERELKATETALAETQATQDEREFKMLENVQAQVQREQANIEAYRQAVLEDIATREAILAAKTPDIEAFMEQVQSQAEEHINTILQNADEQAELNKRVYGKIITNQYAELHLMRKPDMVNAVAPEEFQANDAIRLLAEYGIVVKEPIVNPTDTGFSLSFKVLPRLTKKDASKDGSEADIPFSVAEAGKIISSRLLVALKASVPGCEREPSIEYEYLRIRLIFDMRPVPQKQKFKVSGKDGFGISEPDESHFTEFMDKCSHLAFFGNTGRGKSVAIRNAVGAMMQSLGGEIEVIVGDPKFTEAMRDLNPRYVGARECLLGIRAASEELTRRLEIREADYRANRPYQEFSKTIYFFDEVNELLANFNKPIDPEVKDWLEENDLPKENAVSIYLSRLWRLSREVNIVTLVAGQNLKPSALKINVVELGNFGMIFFGDAIQEGIDYRCKGTEGTALEGEYQLRRKRAEESDLVEFGFYALYALPNMRPYFAALPKPKTYAVVLSSSVITQGVLEETLDAQDVSQEGALEDVKQSLEALLNKECEPTSALECNPVSLESTPKKPRKKPGQVGAPCPKCGGISTTRRGKGKRPNSMKISCKDCGKSSTIDA